MEKNYIIIDYNAISEEDTAKDVYNNQLCFKFNHTMPHTPEYDALVHEHAVVVGVPAKVIKYIN